MKKKSVTLQAKEIKQLLKKDELTIKVCLALKMGYTIQEIAKKTNIQIRTIESIKNDLLKEKMLEAAPDDMYKVALQAAREDDDFASILAQAQEYHKRDLLPRHILLLYQIMEYGIDTDVLLYLMANLQENEKYSEEYFAKVAKQWKDSNILHFEDIGIKETEDEYYTAAKQGFAIHRMLTKKELEYIEKWKRYGLSYKLVKLACERTVFQTGKIAFAYCDKILREWQQNNVQSELDIATLDKEYKKQRREELARRKEMSNRKRRGQSPKDSETTIIQNNILAVQNVYVTNNSEEKENYVDDVGVENLDE